MTSRRACITIVIQLLLVVPAAAAHGADAGPGPYDPLMIGLHAWMAPEGALAEAPPEDARLAFAAPAQATDPNPALHFAIEAPQPFFTQRGVSVTLVVETAFAGPAQDQDGDSFEIALTRNGEPIEGGAARGGIGPLMRPDETHTLEVALAPPGTLYAAGDTMGLRVRPLMPLAKGDALFLRVGAEGSRADFEALRVPTVRDLGLHEPGQIPFHPVEESFRPSEKDAVLRTLTVRHDQVALDNDTLPANAPAYLVVVGDEPRETAGADHGAFGVEERREKAHRIRVGAQLVHAHPGVAIAVRLPIDAGLTTIACDPPCPQAGFPLSLRRDPEVVPVGDQRSALIPPPPDRTGIPSSDETRAQGEPQAETPLPLALPIAALGVAALAAARRRRAS